MNLVIIGQGAMGLLWYSHFQQLSTNRVTVHLLPSRTILQDKFIDTNYTYTHLHGLSEQRDYHVANTQNIQQADSVLLCVKAYQVKIVIAQIAPLLKKSAVVILAHNGMGTWQDIPLQTQQQHVFLALLTTQACVRVTRKHIIHTGKGESDLGLINGELSLLKQQQITQLFNGVLPTVSWHENIIEKQWQKLAINCVINPLTALYNITNGDVNNNTFKDIRTQIIEEIIQISHTEKQTFTAQCLDELITRVAAATAKNCSSMRADVLAKRTTEIDYINGYVHRLGLKHNIATPANTRLWQQINTLSH